MLNLLEYMSDADWDALKRKWNEVNNRVRTVEITADEYSELWRNIGLAKSDLDRLAREKYEAERKLKSATDLIERMKAEIEELESERGKSVPLQAADLPFSTPAYDYNPERDISERKEEVRDGKYGSLGD